MSAFVLLLARWGVPQGLRKPLAYVGAALAAIALLGLLWAIWLHFHDKVVIERHETVIAREIDRATTAADAAANANDARRRIDDARAAILTEEALRHAEQDHPVEVRAPAGPGARAVADSLRTRTPAPGAAAGR